MTTGLVLTYACSDFLSPRRRSELAEPALRSWDQPDAPSGVLNADPKTGGGSVSLGAYFPMTTIVDVIASGYVVQHDNFGFSADLNWGPGGRANTTNPPKVAVIEAYPNGSRAWQFAFNNNQVADTITMVMQPGHSIQSVVRDATPGLRHWPWYQYWTNRYIYCDTWTDPPCYTFSGSHSISVVPKQASYTARADSTLYTIGETATIAMTTTPGAMAGSRTPIQIDTARWVPDPDSVGGNSDDSVRVVGCTNYRWRDPTNNSGSDWLCDHAILGAGTLTLVGHANGFRQSPSVHISVRDPRLTLDVSRSRVHAGDTVIFTPSWSDGLTPVPYAWKWFPDSLPQPNQPDCAQTDQTCRQVVRVSGTMKVWVMRNGIKRAASRHVTVYTTFDLVVDSTAAHLQSNVRFTPQLDGKTARAARWRWAPQDPAVQDSTTCIADTTCVKQLVTTGTMWAYLELSGGDSASATVTVIADSSGCGSNSVAKSARGLSLDCTSDPPHVVVTANDSTVVALDTVTFTAEVYSSGVHVSAVGWKWVPKFGVAWDPWTKACDGVELTCRIPLHGTGDMYYIVLDDEHNEITGSVHVEAAVPDDVGDDNVSGDAPLSDTGAGGTSGLPVDEYTGRSILATGVLSGEWFYTQGCAQCNGGPFTEPAVDIPNHYGDCTDFVWAAIRNTLGSSWPHDYDQKMSTSMYNSLDSTRLAAHGFLQVDSASVQMGDIVVRTKIQGSGHAGIFIGWIGGGIPGGWANNGWPATHDQEGHNGLTKLFLFTHKDSTVTKFFRPLKS